MRDNLMVDTTDTARILGGGAREEISDVKCRQIVDLWGESQASGSTRGHENDIGERWRIV